jgi:hypothetical protein
MSRTRGRPTVLISSKQRSAADKALANSRRSAQNPQTNDVRSQEGAEDFELFFGDTFEEKTDPSQGSAGLGIIESSATWSFTPRSKARSYQERVAELDSLLQEAAGGSVTFPALPDSSPLFTKIMDNAKQFFASFKNGILQIDAGILTFGSDPEKSRTFRNAMADLVKLKERARGLLQVLTEAQSRKLRLTPRNGSMLYERLAILIDMILLMERNRTRFLNHWIDVRDLASSICNDRISQRVLELDHGTLTTTLHQAPEVARSAASGPMDDATPATLTRRVGNMNLNSQAVFVQAGHPVAFEQPMSFDQLTQLVLDLKNPERHHHKYPADFWVNTEDATEATKQGYQVYIRKNKVTPLFSGDDDDESVVPWSTFWRHFRNMFNKFTWETFPREARLTALFESTKGSAQELVSSFQNSPEPDSYEMCIRCLFETYGTPGQSLHVIKNNITNLRPASNKTKDVLKYATRLNSLTNLLMTSGEAEDQAYLLGADSLYENMPTTVRGQFNSFYKYDGKGFSDFSRTNGPGGSKAAYQQLSGWMRRNARQFADSIVPSETGYTEWALQNNTGLFASLTSSPKQSSSTAPTSNSAPNTPASDTSKSQAGRNGETPGTPNRGYKRGGGFGGGSSDSKRPRGPRCAFHQNNDHHSNDCTYTVAERTAKLKEHKGCYNCLNGGHGVTGCRSHNSCKNCSLYGHSGRKHHTALCRTAIHKDFPKFQSRNITDNAELTPQASASAGQASQAQHNTILASLINTPISLERLEQIRALLDKPMSPSTTN